MVTQLSVEVFRDAFTPDVDLEAAIEGIALVNDVTRNSLELIGSTRKMRVSNPDEPSVRATAIRWPRLSADFNIVVSAKHLTIDDSPDPLGFASRNYVKGGGNALVSTAGYDATEPIYTAAHEMGHLFGLRYGRDAVHCANRLCLMYPSSQRTEEDTQVQRRGFSRLLERVGYLGPRYEVVHGVYNKEFCDPCHESLARKAFFLLKFRNGEYIPKEWL